MTRLLQTVYGACSIVSQSPARNLQLLPSLASFHRAGEALSAGFASTSNPAAADWADESNFVPDPSARPSSATLPSSAPMRSDRQGPKRERNLLDYQHLLNDVANAKRTYLIRDILDEMQLNGIAPDKLFFEHAMSASMRSTRVGDCFFYYEEMKRRGMQPGDKEKGYLVAVLARHGDLDAAVKLFGEVDTEKQERGFELHTALVNAFGEQGDVEGVKRQSAIMLEKYRDTPFAITYAYSALLKAYRKRSPVARTPEDRQRFAEEVLATLEEAQAAQRASSVPQKTWPIPVGALFALQRNGCHEAVVRLFETMDPADRDSPMSWAYVHAVTSYQKDATGVFFWPSDQDEQFAYAWEYGRYLEEIGKGESAAVSSSSDDEEDDSQGASSSEDEDELSGPPGVRGNDEASPAPATEFITLMGPGRKPMRIPKQWRWVPRLQFTKMRLRFLSRLADANSWARAQELYHEMRAKGLVLPAAETLELIEASLHMECIGHKESVKFGMEVLEGFGKMGYQQKFINSTVGSQLLRFACQKAVGDLSLAHLLWDRLRKQGDVPERQACRSYYMALKQRDSDEERLANVRQIIDKHHGVIFNRSTLRRERIQTRQITTDAAANASSSTSNLETVGDHAHGPDKIAAQDL